MTALIMMLLLTCGSTVIFVFTEVIGHSHSSFNKYLGQSVNPILIICHIFSPLENLFAGFGLLECISTETDCSLSVAILLGMIA